MGDQQISDATIAAVRRDRLERGHTLGELTDRYGAGAVVKALGVAYMAHALGVDRPIEESDDDE